MSEFLLRLSSFALSSNAGEIADSMAGVLAGLFSIIVVLAVIVFTVVLSVGMFVLTGFPLYRMAKRAGIANPWLAFLPFGNYWIMMLLTKRPFDLFGGAIVVERRKAAGLVTLILAGPIIINFVGGIFTVIPIIGMIVGVFVWLLMMAYTVVMYILFYFINEGIIETYTPNDPNKLVWLILSLIIPIVFTVWQYIHMNDEPDYTYEEYYRKVANRNAAKQSPVPAGNTQTTTGDMNVTENSSEVKPVNLEKK